MGMGVNQDTRVDNNYQPYQPSSQTNNSPSTGFSQQDSFVRNPGSGQTVQDTGGSAYLPTTDDLPQLICDQLPGNSLSEPTFTKTSDSSGSTNYDVAVHGGHTSVTVSAAQATSDNSRVLYTFHVGGQDIQVTYPHSSSTTGENNLPSIDQLAKAFAAEPSDVQKALSRRTIEVRDSMNTRANALADASDSVIRLFSNEQLPFNVFAGTLAHEAGHAVETDFFDNDKSGRYAAAVADDSVHPSQYAGANNFEDFAESFELYENVIGTDQEAAQRQNYPARFALFDEISKHIQAASTYTAPVTTSGDDNP